MRHSKIVGAVLCILSLYALDAYSRQIGYSPSSFLIVLVNRADPSGATIANSLKSGLLAQKKTVFLPAIGGVWEDSGVPPQNSLRHIGAAVPAAVTAQFEGGSPSITLQTLLGNMSQQPQDTIENVYHHAIEMKVAGYPAILRLPITKACPVISQAPTNDLQAIAFRKLPLYPSKPFALEPGKVFGLTQFTAEPATRQLELTHTILTSIQAGAKAQFALLLEAAGKILRFAFYQ